MVRCQRLVPQKIGPPMRCEFVGDEARMHYALLYVPNKRVLKEATQVWFCPPCAATLVSELMASEDKYRREIERNRQHIKESVRGDPASVQKRHELQRRNENLRAIVQTTRNRACRWCSRPLTSTDAHTQETPYAHYPIRQEGDSFAHADVHSPHGYGRAWLMFHVWCAAEWLEMRCTSVGRRAEPPRRKDVAMLVATMKGTPQRTLEADG